MAVTLSQIMDETADGVATVGDLEIGFTYRPNAVTVDMAMKLAEEKIDVIDLLSEVLVSWDVVQTEGEDFPPTAENMRLVPVPLITAISSQVSGADAQSGEATGSFGNG